MKSFNSTFIELLMGPGPSDVHPRILSAMARQTIGHLDPAFIEMMDETKQMLQYAFMTENAANYAYLSSRFCWHGGVLC